LGEGGGALEEHVLQQVGHAGLAVALVARADEDRHVDGDLGGGVVGEEEEADAVVVAGLGDALDGGGLLRLGGALGGGGGRGRGQGGKGPGKAGRSAPGYRASPESSCKPIQGVVGFRGTSPLHCRAPGGAGEPRPQSRLRLRGAWREAASGKKGQGALTLTAA